MEQRPDIIFDNKDISIVDSMTQLITWQQLENNRIYRFAFKKLKIK